LVGTTRGGAPGRWSTTRCSTSRRGGRACPVCSAALLGIGTTTALRRTRSGPRGRHILRSLDPGVPRWAAPAGAAPAAERVRAAAPPGSKSVRIWRRDGVGRDHGPYAPGSLCAAPSGGTLRCEQAAAAGRKAYPRKRQGVTAGKRITCHNGALLTSALVRSSSLGQALEEARVCYPRKSHEEADMAWF
jgi:hypothetical protein